MKFTDDNLSKEDRLELDKRNAPNELTEPCTIKIDQFEVLNMRRCQRWHGEQEGGISSWSLNDWMVGTVGELGEAANILKKMRRIQGGMSNINFEAERHITEVADGARKAQHELADTFIYMVILAKQLEKHGAPSLSQAIRYAFNQKSREYGFPERIGQHSVYLAFDGEPEAPKKYSAEWVEDQVREKKANKLPHHDCAICGQWVSYKFYPVMNDKYDVRFFSSCGCGSAPPQPSSFAKISDWLRMQSTDEMRDKIMSRLA